MGETSTIVKLAERRGRMAKKLFDKEVMDEIIKGCKMCDGGDEAGGFAVFDAAVRSATSAAEEELSEAEFTDFIHRMWETAKCARNFEGGDEAPCW